MGYPAWRLARTGIRLAKNSPFNPGSAPTEGWAWRSNVATGSRSTLYDNVPTRIVFRPRESRLTAYNSKTRDGKTWTMNPREFAEYRGDLQSIGPA